MTPQVVACHGVRGPADAGTAVDADDDGVPDADTAVPDADAGVPLEAAPTC